jgi:hypothetical protein
MHRNTSSSAPDAGDRATDGVAGQAEDASKSFADPLNFTELLALLGYRPGEQISVGHAAAGKGAKFFTTVVPWEQAPDEAARHPGGNCWWGANPVEGVKPGRRGTVEQVTRLVALVADLDLKADGLASDEAIDKVITELSDILGAWPTVMINSGHGRQPLWLLDPDDPATDLAVGDNRADARALYRRFIRLVRAVAERHGGDVDSTCDLSRVWRVADTLNVKDPDHPVRVTAYRDLGPVPGDPDSGDLLTVEHVREVLDAQDIPEYSEDRELLGEVVLAPDEWETGGKTCNYVAQMLDAWRKEGPKKRIGRHPTLLARAVRLTCAQRIGHIDAADFARTKKAIEAQFTAWCVNGVCGEKREVAENEIKDVWTWATKKVAAMSDDRCREELAGKDGQPHWHADLDDIDLVGEIMKDEQQQQTTGSSSTPTATPSSSSSSSTNLPPSVDVAGLWDRPELRHLHTYAESKLVEPLGALGATLSRMLAMLHPHYVLPGVVVGPGSLNFYCTLVGRSGAGKGGPDAVAEAAFLPVTGSVELPPEALNEWIDPLSGEELYTAELGSGEGFGHAYVRPDKKTKELRQVRTSVLYLSPEIDWLRGVGGRQQSTLIPVLRKAWSGEGLNPQYAAADKRVRLAKHSYRVALTVGVQPERADVLLDDADGGLPQRFIWMPVASADAPDEEPETPEPMRIRIPLPPAGITPLVVCPEAVAEIKAAGRRRRRGEGDDLDTHALFCREKVAAGLALLNGHLITQGVTLEDWELAGLVMKVSDATRNWVVDVRRREQAQANRARGEAEAERELVKRSVTEQAELKRVVDRIHAFLTREKDWVTYGKVRAAVREELRKWTDDALTVLVTVGQIDHEDHEYHGQMTTRYRSRS